jgi:hypothetical protein
MQWPFRAARKPADEPLPDPAPLPEADVIARGRAATRLLGDPFLKAAFEEIQNDIYRQWAASKPSQTELREEMFRLLKGLELVEAKLRNYRGAATVLVAQREAEDKEDKKAAA